MERPAGLADHRRRPRPADAAGYWRAFAGELSGSVAAAALAFRVEACPAAYCAAYSVAWQVGACLAAAWRSVAFPVASKVALGGFPPAVRPDAFRVAAWPAGGAAWWVGERRPVPFLLAAGYLACSVAFPAYW